MIAGYILTGGKNRRMKGRKKLLLTYEGRSFLEWILEAMSRFPKVYLSVDDREHWKSLLEQSYSTTEKSVANGPLNPYNLDLDTFLVEDIWKDAGPLGGIASGLTICKEEALFVTACDMPLIRKEHIEKLVSRYEKESVPVPTLAYAGGRLQPLFGIYPKTVLPVFQRSLDEENYKMMEALEEVGYQCVELGDEVSFNCNTQEEYEKIQGKEPGKEDYT